MQVTGVDRVLDVRGLRCPMPVLKANEEIEKLEPGRVLQVIADDPAAEPDLQSWAKWRGYEILEIRKEGKDLFISIRR